MADTRSSSGSYLTRAGELDAGAAGRGLRTIHDSLADYDGDLPRAGRAEEVRAMLQPFPPSDDVELLCELASRDLPEGRRCTGTPISSTTSKLLQGRSGTTWRRRAAGRVNTTSPPSCWTTAQAMQIPKPGAPSPHMEATTRSSSSRRSRSTRRGSPRRSWPRSSAARTKQPLSNDSCGSCGALRGLDRIAAAARSSARKRQEGDDHGTHTVAARAAAAGRRAPRGRAARGPGRGAASPPRGAGVLAEGLPQADRSRRCRTSRGRSRRPRSCAARAGRDRAANRDRRRRHRRA